MKLDTKFVRSRLGRRIVTLFMLCALLPVAVLAGCNSPEITDLSNDLMGTWKTSESRYADRFITLEKTRISFGTGGSDYTIHPISSVEGREEPEEGRVLYTVYYPLDDQEQLFSFYHYPASQSIRFKNQDNFEWTRSPPE